VTVSKRYEVICSGLLVLVFVSLKIPTLNLPIYHDETYVVANGWQILHAGFFPFPEGAEALGHPPVGFELAALALLVLPQQPWSVHVMSVLLAVVALLFTYVVGKSLWDRSTGAMAAGMLATCPLFFAQAGILQLDLVVTTFSIVAIYALIHERFSLYIISGSLMVLSKETSVCWIPAMVAYACFKPHNLPALLRTKRLMLFSLPLIAFFCWLLANKMLGGFWWGDPVTIAANKEIVAANLHMGLVKRFAIRWIQLLNPDRSGILPMVLLLGIAKWWWRIRQKMDRELTLKAVLREHGDLAFMSGAALTYLAFHSLFGVLSPRYLLPVLPAMCLMAAVSLRYILAQRAAYGLSLVIPLFVLGWFRTPDKFSAAEATMDYVDIVKANRVASIFVEQHHSNDIILASFWQSGANLQTPMFGYVRHPLRVSTVGSDPLVADASGPRFDLVYLSSTDQFRLQVEEIIRRKRLKEIRRFTSGRYFVSLYR
jgi:4-amino-4-deoxy-L-arabinose transferase-like glycosyltransferase